LDELDHEASIGPWTRLAEIWKLQAGARRGAMIWRMSLRSSLMVMTVLTLAGCDRATVIVEQPEPTPVTSPAAQEQEREREAIREAVHRYAAALEARDAAAASATVTSETFELYDELRLLALNAPRTQLETLDLMSVMLVLQIRARFRRGELEAVDGRTLFERAVEAGLVGEEVGEVPLDEIWIDDARAHAEVRIEGQPVVWMRAQDEQWRVDIPTMLRSLGPAIESLARDRVLSDGKLRTALALVVIGSDDSVDMDVLDGPLE
jgi:hypothetical protein